MISLALGGGAGPPRLLAIGCHPDDIEIGSAGTILTLAAARPNLLVTWVVLAGAGSRGDEAREAALDLMGGVAECTVLVEGFRDGFLPYEGGRVKELFEELKGWVRPDIVLTHQRDDLHQDHRLACELAWNTWRDHLILEYEVPKYDGDMGAPNLFVPLAEEVVERKLAVLDTHFASQRDKRWFDERLFRGLMRLRGMEANAPSGYAEAFYCRKAVLGT